MARLIKGAHSLLAFNRLAEEAGELTLDSFTSKESAEKAQRLIIEVLELANEGNKAEETIMKEKYGINFNGEGRMYSINEHICIHHVKMGEVCKDCNERVPF